MFCETAKEELDGSELAESPKSIRRSRSTACSPGRKPMELLFVVGYCRDLVYVSDVDGSAELCGGWQKHGNKSRHGDIDGDGDESSSRS